MKISKDKKREYLIKGVFGFVFCIVVYFIFSPSKGEKEETTTTGLNTELPDGKAKPLQSKMAAYEDEKPEKSRMKSLDDYMSDLSIMEVKEEPLSQSEEINRGAYALENSLNSMPVQPDAFDYLLIENTRLEEQVKELRTELRNKQNEDRYLQQQAILQESLKMSAQYSNQGVKELTPYAETERETVSVTALSGDVVSNIGEELLLNKPYNFDFNTAVGGNPEYGKNTIRACIHEDQTVTTGEKVKLRLLEPLQAGHYIIPKNHQIAGVCALNGDRMEIHITSIELEGNILPVKISIYDTDGMSGVYCPGSMELDAIKETAAGMGASMGSSISLSTSTTQQIASDVTRGLISGSSQYLSKKIRMVKVTLKGNYELLLLPN